MGRQPGISVITVTNRYGGIDINWTALKRQTFKDFEWVLGDTLYGQRNDSVKSYTLGDRRVKHYQQGHKDPQAKTWLNHAENEAIAKSNGELIVLLQDYIWITPDGLQKYWDQYKANPKAFVSGVGHQYQGEPIVNPQGLITVFKNPYERQPIVRVWNDPRVRTDLGSYHPCRAIDWEGNYAMAPRQMFYDLGGFDEEYDYQGHAFDNCSIAERAVMLGYEPYLDQSNESFSVNHDAFFENTVKHNDFMQIATFHQKRMDDVRTGRHPLKYGYLDINPRSAISETE